MKDTVVISGGAGFIGSHLCEQFLEQNFRVICLDNLLTGQESNLLKAKEKSDFTFIHCDVITANSFTSLLRKEHITHVLHLASPASVIDYQKYPEETALANSIGTRNLLQLCHEHDAKFLLASTSEIYGDPKEHPQKETYWGNVNPIGPRSCYDESKRFAEMITMLYKNKYNVDTRIVRIFNTYGPRMRKTDGRVISNFMTQALDGNPITVYGTGKQTRSFCYVSDLVGGLFNASTLPHLSSEVINLGNPEEYTVEEIAKKIKDMTGSDSQITYKKLPQDDPRERNPDIRKAMRLLDWMPHVTLREGLLRTMEYYQTLS